MPISRRASQRHWRRSRSGAAQGYQPWVTESGCVLWVSADDAGVSTTSASVADASDFTTANWTKTGVTVTANASGAYDRLTASATTATTQQVPTNFSTGSMTLTFTADVIREADDWICLEMFASAGGRVWFNINTGAVGTTGVNLTAASITSIGGGAFRISATSGVGGNYVMLRNAGGDNTLTCSIGHTFLASNVAVDQTRATAFLNMVSGASWAQASANLQPRFNPTGFNGAPCFEVGGQQEILSTEAAVVAALVNNVDHTLFYVVSTISGGSGTVFSAANSGVNTSRVKRWGRGATDVWQYATVDDASAVTTSTSTSGAYAAGSHLVVFSSSGGTVSHRMDLVAQTLDVTTNSPATLTCNRAGLFSKVDSVQDSRCSGRVAALGLWNVALSAAAISRVENYLRSKWGTP